MFSAKEAHLTSLYEKSKLPERPDEGAIRAVLLNCLEQHFGRMIMYCAMSAALVGASSEIKILTDLQNLLSKHQGVR